MIYDVRVDQFSGSWRWLSRRLGRCHNLLSATLSEHQSELPVGGGVSDASLLLDRRVREVEGSQNTRGFRIKICLHKTQITHRKDMNRQDILLHGVSLAKKTALEIGPLANPIVTREMGEVIYVDYADTAFLRRRYEHDPNVDTTKIVDIDATWGAGTLQEAIGAHRKVDYVIACHVIEHVPDLITWLNEIGHVLTNDGEVRLAIPDKRYSFDYLRSETRFADVVSANLVRARIPQPREIIDFAVNKTGVDTGAAWRGEVDVSALPRDFTFAGAMWLAQDAIANGTYHDVHCWVFTPYSFAKLMGELVDAGLIHFMCADFIDTAHDQLEFFSTLKPSLDKAKCMESWRAMCDSVQRPNPGINDTVRLKQELLECNANLHKLDAQLRSCQDLANNYRTSTSWKITAPLRTFVTVWRKLFARKPPG